MTQKKRWKSDDLYLQLERVNAFGVSELFIIQLDLDFNDMQVKNGRNRCDRKCGGTEKKSYSKFI